MRLTEIEGSPFTMYCYNKIVCIKYSLYEGKLIILKSIKISTID